MRWLFHVVPAADLGWGKDGRFRPPSLESEGFVHASFHGSVVESARLYFPNEDRLAVIAIDPRRLDVPVEIAETPRGPMPHLHGPIPVDAVRVIALDAVETFPDEVTGTRFAFAAFDGMTLLDLVGPLDVLSRIASMGFDPTSRCEVFALTVDEEGENVVWSGAGASLVTTRFRPSLDDVDVLVLAGGKGARDVVVDGEAMDYLRAFPSNRLVASVCTGALLAGAMGRLGGKRATTHASAHGDLARFGATFVDERVVDEGQVVTAGGVTAGIDLGLHLVRRLVGDDVATAIAAQIEH